MKETPVHGIMSGVVPPPSYYDWVKVPKRALTIVKKPWDTVNKKRTSLPAIGGCLLSSSTHSAVVFDLFAQLEITHLPHSSRLPIILGLSRVRPISFKTADAPNPGHKYWHQHAKCSGAGNEGQISAVFLQQEISAVKGLSSKISPEGTGSTMISWTPSYL
ncbi:hypothetical protein IFM47457_05058 [Aspergillus lentulus]|nr:hypothetical protein IFM47457_05058 [Aspergillus lentulus]